LARLILYGVVLALSLFMTVAIHSRRVLGGVVFGMAAVYSVRRPRRWIVCYLGVVGSVVLAPLLQLVRYMNVQHLLDGSISASELLGSVTPRFFWTAVSSAFEGVDHVLEFLHRTNLQQLLMGVDGGVAWLFNAGLALVPRAVWPSKPLISGSVAEQQFLYPEMFVEGPAPTTLPPSFVVDFAYGCGVLAAALLAFLLGRSLAVLWQDLWNHDMPLPARAISLFVFINIFNLVRGGTAILQVTILFVMIAACSFGVHKTGAALWSSVRRIMGRGCVTLHTRSL